MFWDSLAAAGTNLAQWGKHRYPQHKMKLKGAQAFIIAMNSVDRDDD